MGKIPSGWEICPAMGSGLIDDTFFLFKTPLSKGLNQRFAAETQLTPEDIREELETKHETKIGLWIDMNNAEYFNVEDVKNMPGVEYVYFPVPGHSSPTQIYQEKFSKICNEFLEKKCGRCIAIHSTNGFNRPGYLVCAYLMTQKSFPISDAVDQFTRFRSPGFYDQFFVNQLYEIYNEHYRGDRPVVIAPQIVDIPEWDVTRKKKLAKLQRDDPQLSLVDAIAKIAIRRVKI